VSGMMCGTVIAFRYGEVVNMCRRELNHRLCGGVNFAIIYAIMSDSGVSLLILVSTSPTRYTASVLIV